MASYGAGPSVCFHTNIAADVGLAPLINFTVLRWRWEVPMEAHKLLDGASFDPDQLKVVYEAFDAAWELLARHVSTNPKAVEASRMKLATIIIKQIQNGLYAHPEELSDEVIDIMHERPTAL